jgi:REase_DpnII-MboI/AbiJ N-terminal domain 3
MELISIALRRDLREICSTIVLRQIDNIFLGCEIQRGEVSAEILSQTSGERRTRVEEYYASLDWTKTADAQKFLDAISFALMHEYVSQNDKIRLRRLCKIAGFQVDDDIITLSHHEPKSAASSLVSANSQQEKPTEKSTVKLEKKISAITRRDIMDKLYSWTIKGRLDLIEFLEMTWPDLNTMPSPSAGMSLAYEISFMVDSPDWNGDYHFLFYNRLQLGSCDDELFTSFLASCIHPLVRTDKKEVAELLSFFNEALYPDGYVLKPASIQSGRPIYKAFVLGTNDEEYIVSRAVEIIERLARNFHLVVRKLSQRHNDRPPLEIRDEYDVQDLFYALLTPFFEDIRPEEVAPSHAGGHGRIDFLIKAEQIVIEIKKTRPSLKVKELRDQLIVDKEIYRTHPHCRTFIAFVYDPDGHIDNPIGFEKDLSRVAGDMRIKVIVAPR